jgi:hypothetical protein
VAIAALHRRVDGAEKQPPEDVLAGIRVAGRLLPLSEVRPNLGQAGLRNTDLSDLPVDLVLLEAANLEGARLPQPPSWAPSTAI